MRKSQFKMAHTKLVEAALLSFKSNAENGPAHVGMTDHQVINGFVGVQMTTNFQSNMQPQYQVPAPGGGMFGGGGGGGGYGSAPAPGGLFGGGGGGGYASAPAPGNLPSYNEAAAIMSNTGAPSDTAAGFCPKCGTPHAPDCAFCSKCGSKI